jgi:hypothetical protein
MRSWKGASSFLLGRVWIVAYPRNGSRIPIVAAAAPCFLVDRNASDRKSPRVATGEILVGGRGPFYIDFYGGFDRRSGVDGERADRCPVGGGAITTGDLCGGAGEEGTVGWYAFASLRSSHSESESESQNRLDGGRRMTVEVSISTIVLNGSCDGG